MTVDNNAVVHLPDFEEAAERFPAYVVPGERWNGAVIPSFDRETAKKVVWWQNRMARNDPDTIARARWDGQTIVISDPSDPEHPTRVEPDEHGRWPIGARWWTWAEYLTPVEIADHVSQVIAANDSVRWTGWQGIVPALAYEHGPRKAEYLQIAERTLRELPERMGELAFMLARDTAAVACGMSDDDRITCPHHRTWRTSEHIGQCGSAEAGDQR